MKKRENNLITVVILSANEDDVISRAISSGLLLTNNITVIDSFSTDDTVKIAKRMRAKVIFHKLKD
nr:glycosyltransferase family 2 protein [Candidatus Levybacteria bacterium]